MRPRFKAQNLLKYSTGKQVQLDRDLLILQRALNYEVSHWPESQDSKLPLVIDQFQNSQFKAMMLKFLFCHVYTPFVLLQQNCWLWHDYFHKNKSFTLGCREHNSFGFESLIIPKSKQWQNTQRVDYSKKKMYFLETKYDMFTVNCSLLHVSN